MDRKWMVGEVDHPQSGQIKPLRKGAGETSPFETIGLFRAPPAPLPSLSVREAGRG